jgi:hypothetical protein
MIRLSSLNAKRLGAVVGIAAVLGGTAWDLSTESSHQPGPGLTSKGPDDTNLEPQPYTPAPPAGLSAEVTTTTAAVQLVATPPM